LRGVVVVLTGSRPGMLVPIEQGGELVVGRSSESTLALDDDSLSRRHARFFELQGQYFVQDLGSTNGTVVNGDPIEQPKALLDGSRIQLGLSTVLRFMLQNDQEFEAARRLYDSSVRDALTGLYNRHYFEDRLRAEVGYARRHGEDLSLLFLDADHFKRVNDTYGHAAGDEVLRSLGAYLLSTVRDEDIAARIGGEEFVILLRGIGSQGASGAAERLRAGAEALAIEHEGRSITITVSIGLCSLAEDDGIGSAAELLARADGALYQAKEQGRNRVQRA
ncbi:MAG: GGDEF domain-containing protein, partial [Myxococcales bacterium]|nr:GGDEF domain-containing protein [Myxococcales bacterium]